MPPQLRPWQLATPQELIDACQAVRAKRRFRDFVQMAWPIVEPADKLIMNWHVDAICDHLQAVADGGIQQLLINIPPGHGKSKFVSVLFPAWMWTRRPAWRVICGSHSEGLALRDSMDCRRVVESDWYKKLFSSPSNWALTDDQNAKHLFRNTASGSRQAVSVGAGSIGFRANSRIADDPNSQQSALSKLEQASVIEWWDKTMYPRLNDQRVDTSIVVQQRLGEGDLSGHLLRIGGWEHLMLPSEFEPDRRAITYHTVRNGPDLRSVTGGTEADASVKRVEFWRDPRTLAGELLFPTNFPASVLEKARTKNLRDDYAGQHQQRPVPAGGGMFRIADWRYWKPDGTRPDYVGERPRGAFQGPAVSLPKDFDRVIISMDPTFKKTEAGSFVSILVVGAIGGDRFVLDRFHDRVAFDEQVRALGRLITLWPDARERVIEGKANGDAIVDTLHDHYRISGLIPEGVGSLNKEQRAHAYTQPYLKGGNLFLPDGAPWLQEFIEEHALFPVGRTDDEVDCLSQALKHLEAAMETADLWARADLG